MASPPPPPPPPLHALHGTTPHAAGAPFACEEGPYSAALPSLPVLQYYPVRGRAEPIRLALAAARQEWCVPRVRCVMMGSCVGVPMPLLPP
jgi:hypothetical protein